MSTNALRRCLVRRIITNFRRNGTNRSRLILIDADNYARASFDYEKLTPKECRGVEVVNFAATPSRHLDRLRRSTTLYTHHKSKDAADVACVSFATILDAACARHRIKYDVVVITQDGFANELISQLEYAKHRVWLPGGDIRTIL